MRSARFVSVFRWELVRWLTWVIGGIPGIVGIGIRYVVLRLLIGDSDGFFRVLERFVVEYPRGLHLGHDVRINIGCWVNAKGGVEIGQDTIIGPHCVIHSANHRFADQKLPIKSQGFDLAPVKIGTDVWLGARVVILPGVAIGDHTVIGAGSVVTTDIPDRVVAVGSPARVVRSR